MLTGKITVTKNGKIQVQFTNLKGRQNSCNVKDEELSADLLEIKKIEIAKLNGLDIELEEIDGQPKQIREKGKSFVSTKPAKPVKKENIAPPEPIRSSNSPSQNKIPGDFHNPYNFVPALPRNTVKVQESELGDRLPHGHGSYQKGLWSGKISVNLTTVTPLLIPDAANLTEKVDGDTKGHKTYPIRLDPRYLDAKGKPYLPYLPPTSIKGMLRSVYEAVTNSRLSIFSKKHKECLFYRMSAGDGLSLVPARIENDQIKLLFGITSDIPQWNGSKQRWQIPNNAPMYAAWLPRYRRNSHHNLQYPGMKHGDHVNVWLELYQKQRKDKQGNPQVIFQYWLVRKIIPFEQEIGVQPAEGNSYGSHSPAGKPMIKTDGYVCITNRNIENKHDERVFFSYSNNTQHKEPFTHLIKDWEYLIKNYQEIHKDKLREDDLEWSRHVTSEESEQKLTNGTLCYAYVEKDAKGYKIKRLYPVMISRAIFDLPPEALLSPKLSEQEKDIRKLKPAVRLEDLSPGDRVFGWVNQETSGSYKGQLRVNSVKCKSDNSIRYFDKEPFKDGLPLAILGEPKPEQARFYVAKTPNGEPLKDKTKAEGYQEGQGLRGRKVYPHHQLTEEYWSTDSGEIKVGERYREYLRPAKKQDKQNRTIKAWVEPKTTFTFDIEVINLSNVELGALLWLLKEVDYHRLGGGKPLGFGSIKLKIEDTDLRDLRTGKEWEDFYGSLIPIDNPQQTNAINSIEYFKKAVEDAYENTFDRVSFIAAFSQATTGFAQPIHYPRTTPDPKPEGESFEWFVLNESGKKDRIPLRLELPSLTENQALYLDPTKQK